MRILILLLPLLLTLTAGCIVIRSDLGPPVPSDERVAQLQPGQSAWEAVAIMGPPEEWRSPSFSDLARARNEAVQRVSEERELFHRGRLTWTQERREDDLFLFIPVLTFFSWIEQDHASDRVVALLDDQGRVTEVGVTREVGR